MKISIETVMARRSTRSYLPKAIAATERDALAELVAAPGSAPFGTAARFALVGPEFAGGSALKSGRIGTYGVIKDAPAYIVGCVKPGPLAFVDYGYLLEGIVISAAALGLGTCWLGGIFDRKASGAALELKADEVVPAITPVGYPAGNASLADRLIRFSARSSSRKPFGELFFDGSWDRPVEPGDPLAPALEAVRQGPSASNKQPWRIVRAGGAAHLYLMEDARYSRAIPGILLQDMDAGIAMRHLEIGAGAVGVKGSWRRLDADPVPATPPLRYIASFDLC
jgi:nitroreductase